MNTGKDPLKELIKQAQKENLTPGIIKDLVNYVNNEIYVNHFEKKATGVPKIFKPNDVLEALGIKDIKKEASLTKVADYWDLSKPYQPMTKEADYEVTESLKNIQASNDTRRRWKKIAEDKINEAALHAKLVNSLSKLASKKEDLYNETLFILNRESVVPEELLVYTKQAESVDVYEPIARAFTDSKVYSLDLPAYEKLAEAPENYEIKRIPLMDLIDSVKTQRAELDKIASEYSHLYCDNSPEKYREQIAKFLHKLYRIRL
jgi:hypothetical protein